jgi:hypothetical protein
MNLTYRINQVSNLLYKRNLKHPRKWGLIYGLPRSGTSFLLNKFLHISRAGIGDWEIDEIGKGVRKIESMEYIGLNTTLLKSDLAKNILKSAPPGSGSEYDLIVKQINTTSVEVDFLSQLFQEKPSFRVFCLREPVGWRKSAMKKFYLTEKQATELYIKCLKSYDKIGGDILDYKNISNENPLIKSFGLDVNEFRQPKLPIEASNDILWNAYSSFNEKH